VESTPYAPQTSSSFGRCAESGAFKPVIDRTYPFARIVDAHAYVDTGRKKGNVVITLE
jgi:NADPH:quinone reductase-like Zn-dependent oxidoreductase